MPSRRCASFGEVVYAGCHSSKARRHPETNFRSIIPYNHHITLPDQPCVPSIRVKTLYSTICTQPPPLAHSIAPLPPLRRPQLIHLRNPLLKLLVLAFLIAMSFRLPTCQPSSSPLPHTLSPSPGPNSNLIAKRKEHTSHFHGK